MKVILVRHGTSRANEVNQRAYTQVSGQSNSPLTEKGENESDLLRELFVMLAPIHVFSSPSKRSVETAIRATGLQEKEIIQDKRLDERSLGEFDGRDIADLIHEPAYAEFFEGGTIPSRVRHSFAVRVPGGENYADIVDRTKLFFEDRVSPLPSDAVVAIFSHMVTIRCILHWTLQLTEAETLNLRIDQCVPIMISQNLQGQWTLLSPERKDITWTNQ